MVTGQTTELASGDTISRYRIVKLLGEGGMGQVYLAEDHELERQVAIKLLPQHLAANDQFHHRFKLEAKAAASLDHPYVCKVFESGECDGRLFIAMEFIDGESLRDAIDRGSLTPNEAARIGQQVAEALLSAHESGIVHRDLKPDNVMISSHGHAKVMDFGLAKKVLGPAANDAETLLDTTIETQVADLTKTGMALGTVPYMSPEQARGEKVDHRSDIFSFGVLLQEMVTGEHPFRKENPADTLTAIMRDSPPPIEMPKQDHSGVLSSTLSRAMAKKPEDRHQSFSEVVVELREFRAQDSRTVTKSAFHTIVDVSKSASTKSKKPLLLGLGVLALIALGFVLSRFTTDRPATEARVLTEPQTFLVADFVNRSGDEQLDGSLEEALAVGLEESPYLRAFRRGQAREVGRVIRGEDQPAPRLDEEVSRLVAQREGIDLVVGGKIDSLRAGYRVTVDVFEALSGELIDSQERRTDQRDLILGELAQLATSIREVLGESISEDADSSLVETFTAASLVAARHYQTGQELQARGRFGEALGEYEKAVAVDPEMGRAWAGLASCAANLGDSEQSRAHYERALSQSARLTDRERFRTRGGYYLATGQPELAKEQYEQLVSGYPGDPAGYSNLAFSLFMQRDFEGARAMSQRATELFPDLWLPKPITLSTRCMRRTTTERGGGRRCARARDVLSQPAHGRALSLLASGRRTMPWRAIERSSINQGRLPFLAAIGIADLELSRGTRQKLCRRSLT